MKTVPLLSPLVALAKPWSCRRRHEEASKALDRSLTSMRRKIRPWWWRQILPSTTAHVKTRNSTRGYI